MDTAEYDDRCWHELPFDELTTEAAEIARRTGDGELGALAARLHDSPSPMQAELVIHRIETAHAA